MEAPVAAKKRVKVIPPTLEKVVEKKIRWFIKILSEEGRLVDPQEDDYGSTYNPFDSSGYSSMEEAQEDVVRSVDKNNTHYEYRPPTLYNNETWGTTKEYFIIPRIKVRVFHRVVNP